MSDLLDRVVAARKAAEAEHCNPDGSPRTEAQHAAILIAQVQAIIGSQDYIPMTHADIHAVVQATVAQVAPHHPALVAAPEPVLPPAPAAPEIVPIVQDAPAPEEPKT
jgi:hypothetical protein